MDTTLSRFVDAQAGGEFESALAEIRAGRKQGHWIWYVFPQISGLGTSRMSAMYAIRDREEALAYLRHPLLSSRLLEITAAAAEHLSSGARLERLMGSSVDAAKLVSSMTLFGQVARGSSASGGRADAAMAGVAEVILRAAAAQGYPPCRRTLERLEA
jgi:uncharacterized protein (DUF1810 family)